MQRPAAVNEVVFPLGLNAVVATCMGATATLYSLFIAFTNPPGPSIMFIGGLFSLFCGIIMGVITIEFRRLRPWTYSIAKFLLKNMKGGGNLHKKLDDPEVLQAFGLTANLQSPRD